VSDERIERLLERRAAIISKYEDRGGDDRLSVEDDADFRALTERITELREEAGSRGTQTSAGAAVERSLGRLGATGGESRVYSETGRNSYFKDLCTSALGSDPQATSRLMEHSAESRALNRTDGTGGAFVPPAWLMSQWVEIARAGRVTADLCEQRQLPAGTDEIRLPKVSTGTATGIQTGDNTAISDVDLTDESISLPVRTIAGKNDVAVQLLDQSPVDFDQVVFRDLIADFTAKLDQQVLSGSGASGQVLGIRNTTGISTVAYTDTTPTVVELLPRIAESVSTIASQRFLAPTVLVMHPRRWAWILNGRDQSSRPLVVPTAAGPSNASGTNTAFADGHAGQLFGLDVYLDANVPTNVGAGANEDVILVMRASDLVLYESQIRTRIYPVADATSDTLTMRLELYGYMAFSAARYPKSVVEISGTGLVSPTFV
jgi:HK97 family phage major capsid protein